MAFSKLYGLECEIKINRKITKTGSVGRREPENLFGVALQSYATCIAATRRNLISVL